MYLRMKPFALYIVLAFNTLLKASNRKSYPCPLLLCLWWGSSGCPCCFSSLSRSSLPSESNLEEQQVILGLKQMGIVNKDAFGLERELLLI